MTLKEFLIKVGARPDFKGTTALFLNSEVLKYELVWENTSDCAEFCACPVETTNVSININDQTIWIQNGEDR